MAAYSIRCGGLFRSVINAKIRPSTCNAWFGTLQENGPETGQPSKPASAFIMFFRDNFSSIKENNPGEKIPVLSKLAGEMWRKLPDSERQKYLKMGQNAMDNYSEKLKTYTEGLSSEQLEEMKLNAWRTREEKKIKKAYQMALSKHPMPKRPKPALWVYGETVDGKNCTLQELNQKVRSGWQQLSYAEKENYVADYEEKMKQWKADFGLWVQDMVLDGNSDFITTHELKQELQRMGMPKRPMSSFMLYSKASRSDQGSMSIAVYSEESKRLWDNYEKDVSNWKARLSEQELAFSDLAPKVISGTLDREIKAAEQMIEKEKQKAKMTKEKEKARLAKEKEKEKLAKQKEKAKLARLKAEEKFTKQKAKEYEKMAKQMKKENEKIAKQWKK
ncbi:transcription factor A, mitochondrial-like isoform X1 [Argopecten irradians]|uniref:transcription factor A, mitochondrial-like isoform X1 n=1 Tax=Argopecten irradians TaxID=31199 RepID=UPI00371F25BB